MCLYCGESGPGLCPLGPCGFEPLLLRCQEAACRVLSGKSCWFNTHAIHSHGQSVLTPDHAQVATASKKCCSPLHPRLLPVDDRPTLSQPCAASPVSKCCPKP